MSHQRLLQKSRLTAFIRSPSPYRISLFAIHNHHRSFHDFRAYEEDPRWSGWQVVVGIETHAQIKSRRKLFSGALVLCYAFG
jgi:hypothetical protein